MVLTILTKLGLEFFMFVSTFHLVKFTSRATWNMPSLEDFIESLTQEKTKLINMGKIKGPKAHALTVQDGNHQYQKSKDNDKRKAHAHPKKEGYFWCIYMLSILHSFICQSGIRNQKSCYTICVENR
jgi:hypothetical protein